MPPSIKHKFTSGKADGTDITLVKPSNWNDEHDLTLSAAAVYLGRDATGPGPVQELPVASLFGVGMMMMWPGTVAPAGWMLCQGQILAKADYPALNAIIGNLYGGDATQLRLPNMQGRVPAGVDPSQSFLSAPYINNPTVPGGTGGVQTEQTTVSIAGFGVTGGPAYGYGGFSGRVQGSLQASASTSNSSTGGQGGVVGGGPATPDHHHDVTVQWALAPYSNSWNDLYVIDGNFNGLINGGSVATTNVANNLQPTLMINFIIKVS